MKSRYADRESLSHVLAALTYKNRLILRVAMSTGLRVGDIVKLTPDKLRSQRAVIHEQKTGKSRRVYWPLDLYHEMKKHAGKNYVFEGRNSPEKHHTRQAVWADVRRAAKAFRLAHVTPHSARKMWAVERYHETGDLAKVQRELNHSDASVTMIYALADQITYKPGRRKAKRH